MYFLVHYPTTDLQRRLGLLTLVEEATESKGDHFAKLK